MVRSYVCRGFMSLIGSYFDITQIGESCCTTDAATDWRLGEQSLQLNYTLFNNGSEHLKSSRYKTVVEGNRFDNQYMAGKVGLSVLTDLSAEEEGKRRGLMVLASGIPPATVKGTYASLLRPKASTSTSTSKSETKPARPEEFGKSTAPSLAVSAKLRYTPKELQNLYYMFVLQDPRGYLYSEGKTFSDASNNVHPHGLWPKNHPYELKEVQDEFREDLIPTGLVNRWPSALAANPSDTEAHINFWKRQWEVHGRYGLLGQKDYMELIMTLQDYFAPIINSFLRQHTTTRSGERRYLDVSEFIRQLKAQHGIYVTVQPYRKDLERFGQKMEFHSLGQIMIYLDGEDPYKTILPRKVDQHDLSFDMNIM